MKKLLTWLAIRLLKYYDEYIFFTHQEYTDLLANYMHVDNKLKKTVLSNLHIDSARCIFEFPFYVLDKIAWDNHKTFNGEKNENQKEKT